MSDDRDGSQTPGGDDAPLTEDELASLASRSTEMASALGESPPTAAAREEAAAILLRVTAALPALPIGAAGRVVGIGANLAPVLAGAGGLEELTRFLDATLEREELWQGHGNLYRTLFENAFQARRLSRPEAAFEVVARAERLARREPTAGYRVAAWAAVLRHLARQALDQGDWEEHARLLAGLDRAPHEHRADAAPARAALLADMLVLGVDQDRGEKAAEALEQLDAVSRYRHHPEVRTEQARGYCCLIEAFARAAEQGRPVPDLELGHVRRAFEELGALLADHPPTHELAALLAAMAPSGLLTLHALQEPERSLEFLGQLRRVIEVFPGDEELAFELAKGVVNATIVSREDARLVDELERTMRTLLGAAPGSADLADARGRFERVTGRSLEGAAGADVPPPAVPVPPPDLGQGHPGGAIRTPSPEGLRDEEEGWPEACSLASHRYPSPPRAVDALEDAFGRLQAAAATGRDQALQEAMDAYHDALHALSILDTEMGRRKASYGRLVRALIAHLERFPYLVGAGMIGRRLEYMAEDLGDADEPDLLGESRALHQAIVRARGRL